MVRKTGYAWVQSEEKPKFNPKEKEKMLKKVQEEIEKRDKLKSKVSRVAMRGHRIYLYQLIEPFNPEGTNWIKPLIEGKYLEDTYARLSLSKAGGTMCSVDWLRHNDKWMELYKGNLTDCLDYIEEEDDWFN